jgi:hypothetical protein
MNADVLKNALQSPHNAHSRLTNRPTYYSLMLYQNNKANCAKCSSTPHSSDPTLKTPVTGLRRIIQNRGTSVLRGFSGPTDSIVGLGRFVVLCSGRV